MTTSPSPFERRRSALYAAQRTLIERENEPLQSPGGVLTRYRHPVLTADHAPLEWRYDFSEADNPRLLERLGINAIFNAGALLHEGRHLLMARIEGVDRKSFFAIAESQTGVDGFRFWDEPVVIDEAPPSPGGAPAAPTTNVYDARLTAHEDGYVYAVFCAERRDPSAPASDTSAAVAAAGILRTRDLLRWERLADLRTPSPQQRNVVLHPRFVQGRYLLYTRPQDGFIDAGSGGGIAWGLTRSMEDAHVEQEHLLDPRVYHTIKEAKNGAGAPPIETPDGWLHVAHGVRNTAAGLRYVLYAFLCAADDPGRIVYAPGGYLLAPEGDERVGDVSNVLFSNGLTVDPGGRLLLYYGSSDTRLHVAETTVATLLDYVKNTPPDPVTSRGAVEQRLQLILKNRAHR